MVTISVLTLLLSGNILLCPAVWYEPTCLKKAAKAITVGCHSQLLYASPSLSELRSMVAALTASEVPDKTTPG